MLHFFVIASVSEAISFVIAHFKDYYSVWFLTRTDGIASPIFVAGRGKGQKNHLPIIPLIRKNWSGKRIEPLT
jgi:hypothetical protein|uniref:Uncharacterized protein n=1 Tax=candidate division WOR-3 bacterium TaxID=2052148 RepID=A0A7V3RI45_UNCW3